MIYTDGVHLVADSLDELHNFADKIGMKRSWFQYSKKHPHYDLLGSKKALAIKEGAINVTSRKILEISKTL